MDLKKIKPMAMLAEFFGTFGFVYAILASLNGAFVGISTPVVAALALGLVVMMIGVISGAHVNPAVTVGAWSVKKIDTNNAFAYILAQFSGALLAYMVMSGFLSVEVAEFSTANNTWPIFFAEGLGTLLFAFAIASTMHHKYSGVASAVTVGLGLLVGIGFASLISNGVINPAVAAATGSFSWAYVLGPVAGGILGMKLFQYTLTEKGKL